MEVKFAQLLNDLQVNADETTAKIKSSVKDFDEAWNEYLQMIEAYNNSEDEDEKEALKEEIAEYENDLKKADDELVAKIKDWDKNKERYAQMGKKLNESRLAKKAAKQSQQTQPTHQPTPQPIPQQTQPTPTHQATPEPQLVEEEKSGSGFWWLAGFVAVVTLGAVVLKRR